MKNNRSQNVAVIVDAMYKARDTAKFLLGDKWPAKRDEFKPILEAAARRHGSLMAGLHHLIVNAEEAEKDGEYSENGAWFNLFAMATFVEMIEETAPSQNAESNCRSGERP